MRIESVEIQGLRAIAQERVDFAPVSVFCGPNGSGKTTVVGAVIYALTGRFPGVVGATIGDLRPLMGDSAKGFRVTVVGEGIRVIRGVARDKHELVVHVAGAPKTGADAEALLLNHFGDVAMAVDLFDPEKSLWRMSPEKRSAWMFELCASASGWSLGRVVKEMAPVLRADSDDWDSKAGRDAASSMELNLARVESRLRASHRVAREAKVISDGIAAPGFPPTEDEIAAAEAAKTRATDAAAIARRSIEELRAAGEAAQKRLTERGRLDREIADYERGLADLPVHAPPTTDLALLESRVMAAEIAVASVPDPACPTCGGPSREQALAEAKLFEAKVVCGAAQQERDHFAQAVKHVDEMRTEKMRGLQALRDRRAEIEVTKVPPPVTPDATKHLDALTEAVQKAGQKIADLRRVEGVVRERLGQISAATAAEARAKELGGLVARARAVRTAMLSESLAPLRNALQTLGALAPSGKSWWLRDDGALGLVETSLARGLPTSIPVAAMSAGERYCASVALLVAVAMVKKAPWVGLFLDGFEQVDEAARAYVTLALSTVVGQKYVDNVFVAATVAAPPEAVALGEEAALRGATGLIRFYSRTRPSTP